ncbi:MAG: PepSY domain-containing protein [Castellaniella sp.]
MSSHRHTALRLLTPVLALAMTLAAPVSMADSRRDYEFAHQALQQGRMLSLRAVLDRVTAEYAGEPVKIEFERDDGIYLYEIKLIQPSGTLLKLEVDAITGELIKLKRRDIERRKR